MTDQSKPERLRELADKPGRYVIASTAREVATALREYAALLEAGSPQEARGLQCEKDGVCALVSRNDDEWHCTACNGDFIRKVPHEPKPSEATAACTCGAVKEWHKIHDARCPASAASLAAMSFNVQVPCIPHEPPGPLTLDDAGRVFFYEQDHYYLSNFSAFRLRWKGVRFDTSEAAYHWEKFQNGNDSISDAIRFAKSAHEAFKLAEEYKSYRRADWDAVKVDIMREILCAKAEQHEYVRRKLLQTGDRELIENSWRDDYWGWGPNRDGQNMLGKLWMQVRAQLRASQTKEGGV